METENDLLSRVRRRLETNRNWLCMIVGDTGSGKSFTALKIGELLDPDFDAKNVAFSPLELIQLIKISKPGDVVVMDEAGIQFGARNFMSRSNKILSGIFQAFRFKQIILIWTLPDLSMIDITARRLLHTYIETIGVDYKHEQTVVKWFDVKIDRWTGEYKHVYPRIMTSEGPVVVRTVRFGKPSDELIEAYESKKSKAFDEMLDNYEKMLLGLNDSEPPKEKKNKGKKEKKVS